jgi:copper ion binding protein
MSNLIDYTETHQVVGMTCDHCARAVRTEVSAIDGVTDVDVDVTTGAVRVTAEQPVDATALREAVEEAGYTLA